MKLDDCYRIYTKGAPDMLFPATSHYVVANGAVVGIDESNELDASLLGPGEGQGTQGTGHDMLNRTVSLFAKQALRTILMTYRDFSFEEYEELKEQNNNFESEEDREVLE